MRWTIRHRTHYTFDHRVVLEPHVVRLRPRSEPGVQLLSFRLAVAPAPVVRSEHLDAHGNAVTELWFEGATEALTLETTAVVFRHEINPFGFIPVGEVALLRGGYSPALAAQLSAYCCPSVDLAPTVVALARELADAAAAPDRFAAALARRLHELVAYEVRAEGDARPADVTLSRQRGSCRDLAVLFGACCHAVGLAARFVSGYAPAVEAAAESSLHAWSEVYLPGGGWRGFDPVEGLAVSGHHIPVAAAGTAADAAAVIGSYRGDATAAMETKLEIQPTARM